MIGRDYGMGSGREDGAGIFPYRAREPTDSHRDDCSVVRSFIQPGTPIGGFTVKGLVLVIVSVLCSVFIVKRRGSGHRVARAGDDQRLCQQPVSLGPTFALAAGLTLFCVVVFIKGLGVPLPILGSWFGGYHVQIC